ncbi:MAG: hypothetical protein ACREQL_15265 [Candidatus Binatia bacterium]
MRSTLLAVVLFGTIGCSTLREWGQPRSVTTPEPTADASLVAADEALTAGDVRGATAVYEGIVRDHPGERVAAQALNRLAVLHMDFRSPIRDRRAAQAELRRLATEYPTSPWGRQARTLRTLLRQLDRCEEEATRLGADADRLRQTLEDMRDTDLELEQHP